MKKSFYQRGGFTLVELLIVIAIISILASLMFPSLWKAKESARRSACTNNLRHIALVLNIYASENGGTFPPVDNTYNRFLFDPNVIYPEYLTNSMVLVCPSDNEYNPKVNFRLKRDTELSDGSWGATTKALSAGSVHPKCIGATSYIYQGWMMMDDSEMLAGLAVYTWLDSILPISNPATDGWRNRPITDIASFGFDHADGNGGSSSINRLSLGIDRFLMEDINSVLRDVQAGASTVPIVWDQISVDVSEFNHLPSGQNVLYLDSHVEFVRYDKAEGKFPSSPLYAVISGEFEEKNYDECLHAD